MHSIFFRSSILGGGSHCYDVSFVLKSFHQIHYNFFTFFCFICWTPINPLCAIYNAYTSQLYTYFLYASHKHYIYKPTPYYIIDQTHVINYSHCVWDISKRIQIIQMVLYLQFPSHQFVGQVLPNGAIVAHVNAPSICPLPITFRIPYSFSKNIWKPLTIKQLVI